MPEVPVAYLAFLTTSWFRRSTGEHVLASHLKQTRLSVLSGMLKALPEIPYATYYVKKWS